MPFFTPQIPINKKRRILISLSMMMIGSFTVFILLILMNEYMDNPQKSSSKQSSEINVVKPEQPKKPNHQTKKIKKRTRKNKSIKPPMPQFSSSLSGLNVGLPEFNATNFGSVDDSLLGDTSNVIMTEDAVDTPPKATSKPKVTYPAKARAQGITGYVKVNLLIDQSGNVIRSKILESEPEGVFDQAAMQALNSTRFAPARYKGQAVKIWAKTTIFFDLE